MRKALPLKTMPKDLGNLEPLNEDKFFGEFESLEEDARKEKIRSVLKERNDIVDTNRKLFARAKEAEGFKQDEEGSWIKEIEKKPKTDKEPIKSDDKLLERVKKMALRIAQIAPGKEEELFDKWEIETKRDPDAILENKIFQAELADLRTAEANQAATSDVRGESGASGTKDTPEYWIAKATKGPDGELMFHDDTPNDFKLRAAIVEKMVASSKDKKQFYNSK